MMTQVVIGIAQLQVDGRFSRDRYAAVLCSQCGAETESTQLHDAVMASDFVRWQNSRAPPVIAGRRVPFSTRGVTFRSPRLARST
jgi:hypothetical protein